MGKQLICSYCNKIFVEDSDNVDKKQRYIECNYCGGRMLNPYFEDDS